MATILIIDDNETIRIGIKQIVEKMGHTVLAAAWSRRTSTCGSRASSGTPTSSVPPIA